LKLTFLLFILLCCLSTFACKPPKKEKKNTSEPKTKPTWAPLPNKPAGVPPLPKWNLPALPGEWVRKCEKNQTEDGYSRQLIRFGFSPKTYYEKEEFFQDANCLLPTVTYSYLGSYEDKVGSTPEIYEVDYQYEKLELTPHTPEIAQALLAAYQANCNFTEWFSRQTRNLTECLTNKIFGSIKKVGKNDDQILISKQTETNNGISKDKRQIEFQSSSLTKIPKKPEPSK